MNDTFNLTADESTQIFYANIDGWQIWRKPPNAKLVSVLAIGGGGGGGSGGVAASTGVTKNSGGGGGSAAYALATYPGFAFPDVAYIQVGKGGLGGTQGTAPVNGSAGSISYVSANPGTFLSDLILASGAAAAGGGNGAGGAGSAGSVFLLTSSILSQMAMVSALAGVAGGVGANPGTTITPTLILTPGAGGGGCNSSGAPFAGGAINAYGPANSLPGGAAGPSSVSATAGGDGQDGIQFLMVPDKPIFFTGGSGGGASGAGRGGRGGDGAYGCGGGGGGGGLISGGGNGGGGQGGNGLVIITCY